MRKGYEMFEKYYELLQASVAQGEEVTVPVKDLQDISQKVVRAIISGSPEELPDGEPLILIKDLGEKSKATLYIKILEELDQDAAGFSIETFSTK